MRFASFSFDRESKRSSLKRFFSLTFHNRQSHLSPACGFPPSNNHKAITKACQKSTFRISLDSNFKQWGTMRNQRWTSPIYPQKIMFLYTWIASAVNVSRGGKITSHTSGYKPAQISKNDNQPRKSIFNGQNPIHCSAVVVVPRVWQWIYFFFLFLFVHLHKILSGF